MQLVSNLDVLIHHIAISTALQRFLTLDGLTNRFYMLSARGCCFQCMHLPTLTALVFLVIFDYIYPRIHMSFVLADTSLWYENMMCMSDPFTWER